MREADIDSMKRQVRRLIDEAHPALVDFYGGIVGNASPKPAGDTLGRD